MSKFALVILGIMVAVSNAPDRAVIDRIEGECAVIQVEHNGCIWERSVLSERINGCVQEGLQLEIEAAVGSFCHVFLDGTYQFESEDGETRWVLSVGELGFVPDMCRKYTVYFSQNRTKNELCSPECECECCLYDDIFLSAQAC